MFSWLFISIFPISLLSFYPRQTRASKFEDASIKVQKCAVLKPPLLSLLSRDLNNLSNKAAAMDHRKEVPVSGSQGMNKEKNNARKQIVHRQRAVEDDRDINELADTFIKNFRHQLKIQREESFKRFQEMVARGV